MTKIKEEEREARMHGGELLSNLKDSLNDCVTLWSDSSHGYLIVNSINEYEDKKEEIKKDITKLAITSIGALLIVISSIFVPNQIISLPVKVIVDTILSITGIVTGALAIKDVIYITKIKEYLEAAKEYLRKFKPKLFEVLEDNKKLKK